ERATTYHLHFDLQVPTSQGWVFVNPYMTLVAAYERLIRGRGQEIRQGVPVEVPIASIPATANPATAVSAPPVPPTDLTSPATVAATPPETAVESAPPKIESGPGRDAATDEPSSVTAGLPAGAGRGNGGDVAPDDAGAGGQAELRAVGHRFSRTGPRPWN